MDEALPGPASGQDCDGDGYTGTAEATIFRLREETRTHAGVTPGRPTSLLGDAGKHKPHYAR
jgi:hypothetical protein